MENDKAAQKSRLKYELGKLLAPIEGLAEKSPLPTAFEYHVIAEQCKPDCERWGASVQAFATLGKLALRDIAHEIVKGPHNLIYRLHDLTKEIRDDADRQQVLRFELEKCREKALAEIDRVPIEWTAQLHAAQSPFSLYHSVKDAIGTAKQRVHYFDRYLTVDFYDLYMRILSPSIQVKLVTTKGKVGDFGVAAVLTLSQRVFQEFADYQLIECHWDDLHGRYLRIDEKVFDIDSSIGQVSKAPTSFSPTDNTAKAHRILDEIIDKGRPIH
jgi:hypothetical protein